jgi:acyl carrier protein
MKAGSMLTLQTISWEAGQRPSMERIERDEVRQEVFAEARKYVPKKPISEDSKLVADLRLDDGFSCLVANLARRFGLWIQRDQWSSMETVGDLIDQIEKHANDPNTIRVNYALS